MGRGQNRWSNESPKTTCTGMNRLHNVSTVEKQKSSLRLQLNTEKVASKGSYLLMSVIPTGLDWLRNLHLQNGISIINIKPVRGSSFHPECSRRHN